MISIAMSYYNRFSQLSQTLKSIQASQVKDVEIVIVDDFSEDGSKLDRLPDLFPDLSLNIIHMHDRQPTKTYCNPCVPYNVAFRATRGDKIVIQNPECCHMGDVLHHVDTYLGSDNYLSYHCYSATKSETAVLQSGQHMPMFTHKKSRWYNHVFERPLAFHFTCAISRDNLVRLNGFDERYAHGFDYDDAELVNRIKKLGLAIEFVADPWVVHQYHRKTYNNPNNPQPTQNNRELYEQSDHDVGVCADNRESICGI